MIPCTLVGACNSKDSASNLYHSFNRRRVRLLVRQALNTMCGTAVVASAAAVYRGIAIVIVLLELVSSACGRG